MGRCIRIRFVIRHIVYARKTTGKRSVRIKAVSQIRTFKNTFENNNNSMEKTTMGTKRLSAVPLMSTKYRWCPRSTADVHGVPLMSTVYPWGRLELTMKNVKKRQLLKVRTFITLLANWVVWARSAVTVGPEQLCECHGQCTEMLT